jgi:hypothetical protein
MKLGYENAMKTRPQSAKDVTGDFDEYKEFTRRLLAVPHANIKAKLDAEKAAKRTSSAPTRTR